MGLLRIYLFGSIRLLDEDHGSDIKITRSLQSLLAFLLIYPGRAYSREVLASILWGDSTQKRARACLNTALWQLRSALEPKDQVSKGTYLAIDTSGEVGFNWESAYWLDAEALENQVSRFISLPVHTIRPTQAQDVDDLLHTYKGEFLEGFYEDWALRERERLRLLYLQGLAHLLQYYKSQHDVEKSLLCGQKILHLDPLREDIHRELMELYMEGGMRAKALQQYEACQEILSRELDIPPMEETQALRARILTPAVSVPAAAVLAAPSAYPPTISGDIQELANQVRQALDYFQNAQAQLQSLMDLLEKKK